MWQQIIWNDEPDGNIAHIEEHGLTVDDVEHVLAEPDSRRRQPVVGPAMRFRHDPRW